MSVPEQNSSGATRRESTEVWERTEIITRAFPSPAGPAKCVAAVGKGITLGRGHTEPSGVQDGREVSLKAVTSLPAPRALPQLSP